MTARMAKADAAGWTFVTEQDTQSQLVHLRIVVRSGSLSAPTLPGLAHFTARALLRGTRTRPYKDLTDAIERLGGALTCAADPTQTVFSASVLARNLDPFLDVLRDVLTQPAFDPPEMIRLQTILLGELRSSVQDPRALAARAVFKAAYPGTGLDSPAEGTVESVSRITPQQLEAFFRAHYSRQNLLVGVTSPFTREDVVARLSAKLDAVPQGALDAPALPAPSLSRRHALVIDRKGMATVPVFLAVPGVSDADPDAIALEAGNFVFGEDMTSRLMQVLRVENGWTYGAYSGYQQLIAPKAQSGLFSAYLYPSGEFLGQAIPKAVSMLDDYATSGVTADELAHAREALSNRVAFSLDTAEKRLGQRMRELLTGRPFLAADAYRQAVGALELAKLDASIGRHTRADRLLVVAVGDAQALKPLLSELPGFDSAETINIQP